MKAAYIDEHKGRFGVGPICRVLGKSLDCGFLTPRGYRMFRNRPPSRMAARHEALARDILEIHSDFLMAVYGYRKVHAQLLAQGWDPAEVGRDQVMNVMRELGIRGVRRGRTPVTTRPAKGTGGRPELVWRRRPFQDLRDLELATFRWVSWRGLEAPAPVPGLQDTAGGGNRVLSTSSGTSRLTVRTEQKSGHFNNQTVVIEDLAVKGMSRRCAAKPDPDNPGRYLPNGQAAKSGLNRSIMDAGWCRFRLMLEYKAAWYGRELTVIDRWYPSS